MNRLQKAFVLGLLTLAATPAYAQSIQIDATAQTGAVGASVAAQASTSLKDKLKANLGANLEVRIAKGKERADQEIDRRVKTLTELSARVQTMVRLAAEEKNALSASIEAQISALNALKAKIDSDNEIDGLKADIQSITQSYRIYMLVIPQGHVTVTADKIKFVAANAATIAVKLSARIDAAAAVGKDVATLKTSLDDLQLKIADANAQADAAVSLVATLTPDMGDTSKKAANDQALKDARVKLKAGLKDVDAFRKDAHTIVKALANFHLETNASASTTLQ